MKMLWNERSNILLILIFLINVILFVRLEGMVRHNALNIRGYVSVDGEVEINNNRRNPVNVSIDKSDTINVRIDR